VSMPKMHALRTCSPGLYFAHLDQDGLLDTGGSSWSTLNNIDTPNGVGDHELITWNTLLVCGHSKRTAA
jgi:hypothetical protein